MFTLTHLPNQHVLSMYSACTQFSVIFEHVHTYMYVSDDIMATTGEFKILLFDLALCIYVSMYM